MATVVVSQNGVDHNGMPKFLGMSSPSPSNKNGPSNGPLQIKSFSGSAAIPNGAVTSNPGSLSSKLTENVIFKRPVSLPSSETRKKMIITTVPKKVPLINTVGNQSKLIPITALPQTQPVSSSSVSWTNSQPKDVSILHARLTSSASSGALPSVKDGLKLSSDGSPATKTPSSPWTGGEAEQFPLRTYRTPKELSNFTISKSVPIRPMPTLTYEKGLTRLVAVESKTVTMVDMATQVYMPPSEGEGLGVMDVDRVLPATPLHAAPTDLSGSPASSAIPMSQKQLLVVDTKNGKKVLAVPKQILKNYSVPKSFVIGGKPVRSLSGGLANQILGVSRQNMAESTLKPDGSNIMLRSNFVHLTHQMATAKSSLPSQGPLESTVLLPNWAKVPAICKTSVSDSPPVLQTVSNNADASISPLKSPITNVASGSSESVPSHALSNSSPSVFAVPNAEVCKKSENPLGSAPFSNAFVKVGLGYKRRDDPLHTEAPPAKKTCLESGVGPPIAKKDLLNLTEGQVVRTAIILDNKRVVKNVSGKGKDMNGPSQEGSNVSTRKSLGTVVNPNTNGGLDKTSRSDVDKFLKSAFIDFKNCLTFNGDGKLPIHVAVEENDLASVKRQCILLRAKGVSLNVASMKDETPLQLALHFGHTSVVKVLLEHGADAAVIDQDGNSTIHLAVSNAEDALETLLLSKQLSKKVINCLNDEGFSALHLAAQQDKVKAINLLVIHGAEVDFPDGRSGRTALFHAVDRKKYGAQKALVACGADMREPTFTGTTPFLATRADAIAQLSSSIDTVGEEVDLDELLKSSRRSRVSKVR